MDAVQMNTRIDASLKSRGDATLARHGKSASDAVRGLWRYLAEEGTLPEFLKEEGNPSESAPSAALEEGAGLVVRMAKQRGITAPPADMTLDELRYLAFSHKYPAYKVD